MNTQLFFNPVDSQQKNYWHRDPQYHLSLAQQQQALAGPEVVHVRIPLADEPGIELIPGTHKRWDSKEELDVRLERSGKKKYHDLSTGLALPLNKGDILIFSANIIHRGLYGKDRLALDLLFCEALPELMKFVDGDCLPSPAILDKLENPEPFINSIEAKL